MGDRCNVVMVRDGVQTLGYDKASMALPFRLLRGPAWATAWVESMGANTWFLCEIMAQGGAVIDHDRRVLIWFADESMHDIQIRRAFTPLLARSWHGWTVRWAAEGQLDIARALGRSAEEALSPDRRETFMEFLPDESPEAKMAELGLDAFDLDELGMDPRDYVDHHGTAALSFRRDGRDTLWSYGMLGRCAYGGPAAMRQAMDHARPGPLEWRGLAGWGPLWGAHVDFDRDHMGFWSGKPEIDPLGRMSRYWPGWTLEFWGERYERHVATCQGQLVIPRFDALPYQRSVVERAMEPDRPDAWLRVDAPRSPHLQPLLAELMERSDPVAAPAPR